MSSTGISAAGAEGFGPGFAVATTFSRGGSTTCCFTGATSACNGSAFAAFLGASLDTGETEGGGGGGGATPPGGAIVATGSATSAGLSFNSNPESPKSGAARGCALSTATNRGCGLGATPTRHL